MKTYNAWVRNSKKIRKQKIKEEMERRRLSELRFVEKRSFFKKVMAWFKK